jgi:hypothetical protein
MLYAWTGNEAVIANCEFARRIVCYSRPYRRYIDEKMRERRTDPSHNDMQMQRPA